MLVSVLAFVGAASLVILLPGPDTLVVLRSLLREGPRSARRTALGVVTGLSIWAGAAVLGLSALLRASHDGYDALRLVGAVYLCAMGVQALRSRGASAELDGSRPNRRPALGTGYLGGLATDLLNPKVGVFFVTFLPAFVPHGEPVGTTTLLLGAIFAVETGLYFVVFLRFARHIVGWLGRPKLRKALDRGTGAVLIGFGLRLALEP
ncbi:MAG TPA: LysE family translocator [Mycobacteriales bacterium]|nr:LysE family translocator [Mycobacteriales bacterium]